MGRKSGGTESRLTSWKSCLMVVPTLRPDHPLVFFSTKSFIGSTMSGLMVTVTTQKRQSESEATYVLEELGRNVNKKNNRRRKPITKETQVSKPLQGHQAHLAVKPI